MGLIRPEGVWGDQGETKGGGGADRVRGGREEGGEGGSHQHQNQKEEEVIHVIA